MNMSYEFRATSFELRVASCELQAISYEFKMPYLQLETGNSKLFPKYFEQTRKIA